MAKGLSRERLRTLADGCATSSEHTLNPQTPRVTREPLLRIRENHTQSVPPRRASSVHAFGESVVTLNEPRRNSCPPKKKQPKPNNPEPKQNPQSQSVPYIILNSMFGEAVCGFDAMDTSIENRRQVGVANFDTTRSTGHLCR